MDADSFPCTHPQAVLGTSGMCLSILCSDYYEWQRYWQEGALESSRIIILLALSHVWLLATPWTTAHQAPLSMRFSRQEYWSGLPFPPPGELSHPGIKLKSPVAPALAGRFLPLGSSREATREAPAESSSARVYIQGFPQRHTPQSNNLFVLTIEIIFKRFASYIHFILPLAKNNCLLCISMHMSLVNSMVLVKHVR